jgi:hypothetical protein
VAPSSNGIMCSSRFKINCHIAIVYNVPKNCQSCEQNGFENTLNALRDATCVLTAPSCLSLVTYHASL